MNQRRKQVEGWGTERSTSWVFAAPDGEILVNEINTMPGFTETSVYAKLWQAADLPYPDLCDRLVHLAIARHEKARSYEF